MSVEVHPCFILRVMRGLDPRIQLLSSTKLDPQQLGIAELRSLLWPSRKHPAWPVSALTRRPGDDAEWGEAPCLICTSRSSAA